MKRREQCGGTEVSQSPLEDQAGGKLTWQVVWRGQWEEVTAVRGINEEAHRLCRMDSVFWFAFQKGSRPSAQLCLYAPHPSLSSHFQAVPVQLLTLRLHNKSSSCHLDPLTVLLSDAPVKSCTLVFWAVWIPLDQDLWACLITTSRFLPRIQPISCFQHMLLHFCALPPLSWAIRGK